MAMNSQYVIVASLNHFILWQYHTPKVIQQLSTTQLYLIANVHFIPDCCRVYQRFITLKIAKTSAIISMTHHPALSKLLMISIKLAMIYHQILAYQLIPFAVLPYRKQYS